MECRCVAATPAARLARVLEDLQEVTTVRSRRLTALPEPVCTGWNNERYSERGRCREAAGPRYRFSGRALELPRTRETGRHDHGADDGIENDRNAR